MWRRDPGLLSGVLPRLATLDRGDVPGRRHPADRRDEPVAHAADRAVAHHVARNPHEARGPLLPLARANPRPQPPARVGRVVRVADGVACGERLR